MTTYPILKNDPELFTIKTKDVEIKDLKYQTKNLTYQTEKHDHENILKSLKIDKDYYKIEYSNLNKKKVLLNITEIIVGSAYTISSLTMGFVNPGAGIIISSNTAFFN